MSSIVLAGCSYRSGAKVFKWCFSSPTLRISRAASLNSAISRGLRKSKGVGFRGKERPQEGSNDRISEVRRASGSVIRRSADPPSIPKGQLTRDAWRKENALLQQEKRDDSGSSSSGMVLRRLNQNKRESQNRARAGSRHGGSDSSPTSSRFRLRRGKMDIAENDKSPKRRSRAGRFNDPNYSFGKRAMERRASKFTNAEGQGEEWDPLTKKMRSDVDHSLMEGRRRPKMTPAARRSAESDRTALERNPGGSKLSKGRQAYLSRFAESSQWMASEENDSGPNLGSIERGQGYTRRDKDWQRTGTEVGASRERRPNGDNEGTRPTYARMVNDRLPLSIPYTTPASEFLYGTSVVEAALRSRREPRRKLYKLYVYNGENRDSGDGREAIERLAKKTNVPIIYHTESPRLLDKMSAGRPHNGYILEASPLPKLPLISLGPLNTDGPFITECPSGFTVNLDHQSREEAAVNGTSTFIPLLRSPKGQPLNPFILFLDSILDPGNLGGIIRTASFLGITAIALSTRNSAPLSPIVLKASAGASESVTLFSVNKPAGFITDSKRAGWKVYAAVAPKVPSSAPSSNSPNASYDRRSSTREVGFNSSTNSNTPTQTTSDLLYSNPLASSPCILMLGNEGEGLRWNLRSKADVELSIAGAGGAHRGGARGVDSLNVSVAAGVLCQAFLSAVDVGFRRRDWAVGRTGGSGEGGRRRSVEREEGDQEELERGDERSGRAGGGGETALKEPGDLF